MTNSNPCIHHMKWKGDCIWCWIESYRVLESELSAARGALGEFEEHEKWTHSEMEKIVGNKDSFIVLTKKLQAENAQLKADNERIVKQLKDMDDLIGEFNKNEIVLMRKIEALRKQVGE